MKKIFKVTGYLAATFVAILYMAYLFILPNVIKLDKFKPDIQKLVVENSGMNLNYGKAKLVTSPFLELGIKINDINLSLPDNSTLLKADNFKGKVFLPALIFKTVRVSCAEINNPKLNLEIINGEKYKAAKAYEDLVNKKRKEQKSALPKAENTSVDISDVKIVIPALKLNNYQAVINDIKASHSLSLKGEQIRLGYFNGETAKVKADIHFLSDKDENITANLDIDTFLPAFNIEPTEEDNEAVYELPFVNPVSVYRDYNLKSKINSKLKIRQTKKTKKIYAKGFLDIEDTTVTLSGIQLPPSYFKLLAKGHKFEINSNLYVTPQEYLSLQSTASNGRKPFVDISLKSPAVHFSNILTLTKAYLNTLHIKNDMDSMTASGYLLSNFRFKTDFTNIDSNGKFIIRGGNIFDRKIGLLFDNINANLIFDNNIFKVTDTRVLINKRPLSISGQIGGNYGANLNLNANRVPIPELYTAFAPKEIKNSYKINSGFLSAEAKVTGEIKNISAMLKTDLEDFTLSDKAGSFVVSNKLARLGITDFNGDIKGKYTNQGFKFVLPAVNSVIQNDSLVSEISNKLIDITPFDIKVNKASVIKIQGNIEDYLTKPSIHISANGALQNLDIKTLLGDAASPYFEAKGAIPLKANFEAKGKKFKALVQAATDANSYITPVEIAELHNNPMLLQFFAEKNGDMIKIHKTGLYLRRNNRFSDDLRKNMINLKEVIGIRAIVSNLSTEPFINLFKIKIPNDLHGKICIFNNSNFVFGGHLFAYGKVISPKINGNFYVRNFSIPEIFTRIRDIHLGLNNRDVRLNLSDISANGSDFNVNILTDWKLFSEMKLSQVRVNSKYIDLDKLIKVSEAAISNMPKSSATTTAQADIPISILDGNINLRRIKTGNILVNNTTSDISMFKNIFYLNNLHTYPMGGNVRGNVSYNLVTSELNAKVNGKDFDMEKVLLDAMAMKDTLTGDLSFVADISMKGLTQEEQMKSLKGYLDFNVKNGQLGPFGKFENFLMAENLRENAFFSSTIGSVITNIVTIDTSHFNNLLGHLTFDNGFANIEPIKSQGDVMSIYIAGKVGLVDNSADMKLRGKLASTFSDSLGPLANINPVNLIKNTPGLNIVAAKTFSIFCETLSEEEMNALPQLGDGKSDDYATKFQIVLRGDTRKPLKMIKSFKWLALNSEIEAAQGFVDNLPVPNEGEENLTIQELIDLRAQQNTENATVQNSQDTEKDTSIKNKFKSIFHKNKEEK